MNVLEQFVISLGLDTTGLNKDFRETNASIKDFVGSALKTFAALYSINWAKEQLNQFAQVVDEAEKFSKQINVDVESMLLFEGVVGRAGGSVEGFRSSLTSLSGIISDASLGIGRGKVIFEELGIQVKDSNGNVRDSLDIFKELNTSLQGLSSAQQIGFTRKLGIDVNTLRVLQMNNDEIEDLLKNQQRLGVANKQQIEVSAKYNDSLDDLNQSWKAVVGVIAERVLPILTAFALEITKIFVFIKDNDDQIFAFFETVGKVLNYTLIPAISLLATVLVAKLFPSIMSISTATSLMTASFMPFLLIGTLIAVAVALIVDEFMAWKEGGESVLGFFFDGFAKFGKDVKNLVKDIGKWFGDMWTNIKGGFNTFIGFITGIRDAIAGVFTGVFDGLVSGMEFIKEKLNFILEPLGKIKDALGGFFGGGNAKAVQTTQARSIQNNSNKSNTANIGQINVNLKKGNAKEIANNIAPALKGNFAWGSAGGIQ